MAEDSDIIEESAELEGIAEEGISEDDIIEDSIDDELESWASAAPPTISAASAVVVKNIRFIVGLLGFHPVCAPALTPRGSKRQRGHARSVPQIDAT
ncbi:MAG TPA: hypothetical protein VG757_06530 [Devosia sp.]|nr:hypothetical protein [Devosia sp.]